MQVSGWFVMLLGMTTVFIGLIVLMYITKLLSAICGAHRKGSGTK